MTFRGTPSTELVVVTDRERTEPVAVFIDHITRMGYGIHIIPRAHYQFINRVHNPQVVFVDAGSREFRMNTNLVNAVKAAWEYVPVIIIARPEELPRVSFGPSMHDFLILPVNPVELEARIRFALWKTQGSRMPKDILNIENLRMNMATYEVWVDGENIDMTYKEFELLKFLATHRRRVFSREELLEQVWGDDYFGGTRTVDVHIRRLRAKLGPVLGELITTVRNVGYRFG